MRTLTGQYECAHRSALGLDYFTAKLDRLTLYADGRFTLIAQEKSRIMHAAKSLASGQQASMEAPETRQEGTYSSQGDQLFLTFDTGGQEQAQIQDAGIQIGQDSFEKVSESTMMPPPQRLKSNMEDIAKGLKIAGAIGGTVLKAARTLQASTAHEQPEADASYQAAPSQAAPTRQTSQTYQPPATPAYTPPDPPPVPEGALYCDQCGSPVRPDKKFCNRCGARLP